MIQYRAVDFPLEVESNAGEGINGSRGKPMKLSKVNSTACLNTIGRGVVFAGLVLVLAVSSGTSTMGEQDSEIPFRRVLIDQKPPDRPYYKMLGDLDGDGLLDIIIGGATGPLVWYRYPGWKRSEIAPGGWDGVKGGVGDVDGDGDADIVMGGIVWFQNPRLGGGAWKMNRIDTQRAHDVELGDLDGDGRLDVAARDQSAFGKRGNVLYVYRQEIPSSWRKRTIPCPHGEGLKLADLDRDGDLDIVIGELWYENGRQPDSWKQHRYTDSWGEPDAKVEVADLNGDGRPDVVLTPAELRGERHKVAWYEGPSDPKAENWKERIVVPDIEAVIHSLAVGDFDGDGDLDLAIAEMHQGADPDEVSLHINLGGGSSWRKQVLSTEGSHDIVVGDLEGDGDLDIVGANHAGKFHPVEFWRNGLARRGDPKSRRD